MEKVVDKIKYIIVYIDKVIIHTTSHEQPLVVVDTVLQGLEQHNHKMYLAKCFFSNTEVLAPEAIWVGKEKLEILQMLPAPLTKQEV